MIRRREPGITDALARRLLDELEAFALFGVPPIVSHPSAALWGPQGEPLWAPAAVSVLELWEHGERFGLSGPELAHFEGAGNPLEHKQLVRQLVEKLAGCDEDGAYGPP